MTLAPPRPRGRPGKGQRVAFTIRTQPGTKMALETELAARGLDGIGDVVDEWAALRGDRDRELTDARQAAADAKAREAGLLEAIRALRREKDRMAQQLVTYRATRAPKQARRKPPEDAMPPARWSAELVARAAATKCATPACPFYMDPPGFELGETRCMDCRAA